MILPREDHSSVCSRFTTVQSVSENGSSAKPLDLTALTKGVKSFDPLRPPSRILSELLTPGAGITNKEFSTIFQDCQTCWKFHYVAGQGRHACDPIAQAKPDSHLFDLHSYLTTYHAPFGISWAQLTEFFTRCGFCDRVLLRSKDHNHVCSRELRRRSGNLGGAGSSASAA
jgi:hypothetical protein